MTESKLWNHSRRVGRIQFGWHIWRHTYDRPGSSDRWVIKPFVIYDRKDGPTIDLTQYVPTQHQVDAMRQSRERRSGRP